MKQTGDKHETIIIQTFCHRIIKVYGKYKSLSLFFTFKFILFCMRDVVSSVLNVLYLYFFFRF
jgi:hypothetical protein